MEAYGAGLSGQKLDVAAFAKRPLNICRIVAGLLGLFVWRLIASGAWHKGAVPPAVCLFNQSAPTCSFGSALGFFALVAAVILLATEANLDKITGVQQRRRYAMIDLGACGAFAAVFLVAFLVFLSKFSSLDLDEPYKGTSVKMAIFFSFLSAIAWGGAALFSFRRYEEGRTAAAPGLGPSFSQEFANSEARQEGYGYGGAPPDDVPFKNASSQQQPSQGYQQQGGYAPQQQQQQQQAGGYQQPIAPQYAQQQNLYQGY